MSELSCLLISLGSTSSKWIYQEMKKRFNFAEMINLKKIIVGFNHKEKEIKIGKLNLKNYDAIYLRGSFRYKDFLMSISSLIPEETYTPIPAESFLIIHNKILTHLILEKEKIPMPKTYFTPNIERSRDILKEIKYPIMIKFLEGTQGKGVIFLESYAAASSFIDSLNGNEKFLIQEYIPSGGEDIRLIVTGEEVVAAMKRKAAPLEVRSNYHAGGSVEKYEPQEETKKIAIKAAKAVGAEICGVDIIETELGPLVIEINSSPGLQGITKATGINVAGRIVDFIYKRSLENKKRRNIDETNKLLRSIEKENRTSIITNLYVKAGKTVLPEVVTKMANIKDEEEVEITFYEDGFNVKKFK